MTDADRSPRRALILAGGGLKVAFQAGVLQVWLDEAGLSFDLADACSGGTLNQAMYCQGMSGTQIADNWRRYHPLEALDLNWWAYRKLLLADSLFELDAFRETIFPKWGLDVDQLRRSDVEATFNAYNFSEHELAVWTPDQMDEDRLISCISLPMWFPPVVIDGDTHIDSVFVTDANLEEAIRRGADELWIIWTVSQIDEWHGGFTSQYFQIIEASANGTFRRDLERIERNNAAIENGEPGEFGRAIEVKLLQAEVEPHYLLNVSRDRMAEAVNAGVQAARTWCRERDISVDPDRAAPAPRADPETSLRFTETMRGFVAPGLTDYDAGYRRGRQGASDLRAHLTIRMPDVDRFLQDPDHAATADGYLDGRALGARRPVAEGRFNLFVDEGDPRRKFMRYRLFFASSAGEPRTLRGHKEIKDDPGVDAWADTTTLFSHVLRGHVPAAEDDEAKILAAGILRIRLHDFLKQLASFRTEGPTRAARLSALTRFGGLFLGDLWEVYARDIFS
jgi:predicted acylesterase/phospholipase RssA